MKIEKDLNTFNENQFISLFGSVFEKSEWIAAEAFKKKPFKNSQDLIEKMIKTYESCSIEQIIVILNLHPKLAIEKKLTSFSTSGFSDLPSLLRTILQSFSLFSPSKKNNSTLIPFPGLPENTSRTWVVNLVILLVIYYTNIT